MWPKPEIQPVPNASSCPACGSSKPTNEAACPKCGARACPKCLNILSYDQKVCNKCNWSDHNFRVKPIKPPRSHVTSHQIDGFKDIVSDNVDYKCPRCGLPVKDASAPCSNCGQLVDWHVVQSNIPPYSKTTTETTSQVPVQPVTPEVQHEPHAYEPSSPLHDYASKEEFLQAGAYSDDMPETESLQPRIERDWAFDDDKKSKKPLRIILSGMITFLAIIALIVVIVLNNGKSTSPKPSVLEPPVATAGAIEITNSQIMDTTDSSIVIRWETSVPSTTQVAYGTTAQYGQITALDSELVTQHEVRLEALNPDTTYYYEMMSGDTRGNTAIASIQGTFVTSAPPDSTPPVISNVQVNGVSDVSATISWVTDEQATSQIEYGVTAAYGSIVSENDDLAINHTVTITGLQADKTYYFRAISADTYKNRSVSDSGRSFTTMAPIPTGPEVGKRAPDFTVSTLDGDAVTLSSLHGKIVMVNFWSVGCGPCMVEMPDIDEIYKTWSGPIDLVVLAINVGDHETYIRKAIEEKKWEMPIYIDPDRVAVKGYQIYRIPRTFFVDTSGIIRKIELGRFDNKQEIEDALSSIQ